jgi:hypothetical protein
MEGSCEHGNETSGSIKLWEVHEQLQNWWLLKKGSSQSLAAERALTTSHKQQHREN